MPPPAFVGTANEGHHDYLFESLESVRAFAGDDYSTPLFEPEARSLLSRIEPIARHYGVRANTTEH